MWESDRDLRQVFSEASIEALGKKPPTLAALLAQAPDARALPPSLTGEDLAEAQRVLGDLPRVELSATAAVVDCSDIRANDVVTVTVTLRHANLAAGARVPPVYAPRFPYPVKEEWWLFLVDEKARGGTKRLVLPAMTKQAPAAAEETYTMQFQAPPRKGAYVYALHALCTGYVGLDVVTDVRIDVLDALRGPVARETGEGGEDDAEEEEDGSADADMTLENLLGGANREASGYDSDLDDGKAAADAAAAASGGSDGDGVGAAASDAASPARKGGKVGSEKKSAGGKGGSKGGASADKRASPVSSDDAAEKAADAAAAELLAEADAGAAAADGTPQKRKGKGAGSSSK